MVRIGDQVPDFIVPATSHKNVQLNGLRGYQVLIYFYPKNNTPTCIIENQDFAANYPRFRRQNTVVFGVSRDSLESHEAFKDSQALPFELISDYDDRLCHLFNVLKDKELFGKHINSLTRSSFLIDEHGVLIREWRDVDIRNHVHEVIDYIESNPSHLTSKTG